MYFYAHSSRVSADRSTWQRLCGHLAQVGAGAALRASPINAQKAADLLGRGHDLGKYTEDFLGRLDGSGEQVDHSTAGAWHVLDGLEPSLDRLMAELVAYGIAGHHAGLPDMFGDISSLDSRLRRYKDNLSPAWRSEMTLDRECLVPKGFQFKGHDGSRSRGFRFAMLGRYLFSCLVDADYRDTEKYYDTIKGTSRDRDFRQLRELLPEMTSALSKHLTALGSRAVGVVADARREILSSVLSKAAMNPGIFTMNVPTGGGKTLASLAFALDHARHHDMNRIIYGIPFTSVIDQTASIFRDILGHDNVLEHHSAIGDEGADSRGKAKLKMAMEDWSAPVVVTTNVQLFESLMTAKPSKARKIHNIARSVIILDEAQTIPRHLLIPCVAMLDELVQNYGCTVILCTATQPAFNGDVLAAGHRLALPVSGRELAPDPSAMGKRLRRVRFEHAGDLTDSEIVNSISGEHQALVIVNSRKHALQLFQLARTEGMEGLFHLSTRQTAHDRRQILAAVRKRLIEGLSCRVISTSLIEAGVDIDFPKVWRCEAGLDQVAQAAGRCNREGKRSPDNSVVTIFSSPDHPNPKEMRGLIRDMKAAIRKYGDILSPEAIQAYFLETYWRVGDDGLDSNGIIGLFNMSPCGTDFSYRTADERFKLVETNDRSVIIPTSPEVLEILGKAHDPSVRSLDIARRLQTHIVQVPVKAFDRLVAQGKASPEASALRDNEFVVLRDNSLYSMERGLVWEE